MSERKTETRLEEITRAAEELTAEDAERAKGGLNFTKIEFNYRPQAADAEASLVGDPSQWG